MVKSVLNILNLLDIFDSVLIEENQKKENVTLKDIKSTNRGNNCLHFCIIHNNHRIIIQTYKEIARKGLVDIVQGKIELEHEFEKLYKELNLFTDDQINKIFVLYCSIWQKCSAFYKNNADLICEFGPNMSIIFNNNKWKIIVDNVTVCQNQIILDFIEAVEDICQ